MPTQLQYISAIFFILGVPRYPSCYSVCGLEKPFGAKKCPYARIDLTEPEYVTRVCCFACSNSICQQYRTSELDVSTRADPSCMHHVYNILNTNAFPRDRIRKTRLRILLFLPFLFISYPDIK